MSWPLMWHQTQSDLARVWPAALLTAALITLKTYGEATSNTGMGFGSALFQVELYRFGVLLLIVMLWRNLWPAQHTEPDFLTRPISPVVQWLSRLLVLCLFVAVPLAAAEFWLVQQAGLTMPVSFAASNFLAVSAVTCAVSALVLTYPGSRNLLGIAVLLLIAGTVDQSLFLASLLDPPSAAVRATQWTFVLAVSVAMIHRHLMGAGARHLFLTAGMVGFAAFSAYPLLTAKMGSQEQRFGVAEAEDYFLSSSQSGKERKVFLRGGQSPIYRIGKASGQVRWPDGHTQSADIDLQGLTGFPAGAIFPNYRGLDNRGAGTLSFSAVRENPNGMDISGYVSEREFTVLDHVPLEIGNYPVDDGLRVSVNRVNSGEKIASIDAMLYFLHRRLIPKQRYHLALVHHRRQEYAMSRDNGWGFNFVGDPMRLNVGFSGQRRQVQVSDHNLDISPAQWLSEAEVLVIEETSKFAGFRQLELTLKPVASH